MKRQVIYTAIALGVIALPALALESVSSGGDSGEVKLNMRLSVIESSLKSQVDKLQRYLDAVEVCNGKGLLYGPNSTKPKDADDCVKPAERDVDAQNYAFERDAVNMPVSDRVGKVGMDICPPEHFITNDGTTSVKCVPIPNAPSGSTPGACAARSITVGTCTYNIPEMTNGQSITRTCEECSTALKRGTLDSLTVTCSNGTAVQIGAATKTCDWSSATSTCDYAASCKPAGAADCTGSVTLTKGSVSCQSASVTQADGTTSLKSCISGNVTLSQNVSCSNGTYIPQGNPVVTATCDSRNVTLRNPNNRTQTCTVSAPHNGKIGQKRTMSCSTGGVNLESELTCAYSIAPEVDTQWRVGTVTVSGGYTGTWQVGVWSKCSACLNLDPDMAIDDGIQKRTVTCSNGDCDPSTKPADEQSCRSDSCAAPATGTWYWDGSQEVGNRGRCSFLGTSCSPVGSQRVCCGSNGVPTGPGNMFCKPRDSRVSKIVDPVYYECRD